MSSVRIFVGLIKCDHTWKASSYWILFCFSNFWIHKLHIQTTFWLWIPLFWYQYWLLLLGVMNCHFSECTDMLYNYYDCVWIFYVLMRVCSVVVCWVLKDCWVSLSFCCCSLISVICFFPAAATWACCTDCTYQGISNNVEASQQRTLLSQRPHPFPLSSETLWQSVEGIGGSS